MIDAELEQWCVILFFVFLFHARLEAWICEFREQKWLVLTLILGQLVNLNRLILYQESMGQKYFDLIQPKFKSSYAISENNN